MVAWIPVHQSLPLPLADDPYGRIVLITDGKEISVGYFEPEYFADSPKDPIQYSSEVWHDEAHVLSADYSGWPKVTHWAELPELPE